MADERALIADVLRGEKESFRTLILEYERLVRQIVHRMVPASGDREDLCQDVFLKVYENLAGFRLECKLSTWIGRIAHNLALNHLRKKREVALGDFQDEESDLDGWPDESQSTELIATQRDMAARLWDEIDRLPVMYGLVVSLYHLQEMRYDEIADVLSLPAGTVKSHLFRARKMLRCRLAARYTVEELCA